MITGTLVNYYHHCKRQCWLHGNKINMEDNSELVKIGKELHHDKLEGGKTVELSVEGIKIDKITADYIIEYKKSDADLNAGKWQLFYYLYILKQKGVIKEGKLIVFEKKTKTSKTHHIELTIEIEEKIKRLEKEIKALLEHKIPEFEFMPICKKCAYSHYCLL